MAFGLPSPPGDIALYIDEDSKVSALIDALRRRGIDVLTTADAGRDGLADDEQLAFAAENGRTLVTANIGDFERIHARWSRAGREHAGIVYWLRKEHSTSAVIRAQTLFATTVEPSEIRSRTAWLRRWM